MELSRKEIGERIAFLRLEKRASQEDVAEFVGITRGAVVRLEVGKRPLGEDEAKKLAEFFGEDIFDFKRSDELRAFQVKKASSTIGRRFRKARRRADFTQAAAARAIGMEQSMISKIENGTRDLTAEELAFFSDLFKVAPEWFTGTGSMLKNEAIDRPEPSERKRIAGVLRRELQYIAESFPLPVLRQTIDLIEVMEQSD